MAATRIKIYANLEDATIHFDNSTVSTKPLGTCVAAAHSQQTDRIKIQRTFLKPNGEPRIFFRRLKYTRVENEAGERLSEAPYNYTRDQVVDYLNVEFSKTLAFDTASYRGVWDASSNSPDLTTITASNGDFFYVGVAGTIDSVDYYVNDVIRYDAANDVWDHLPNLSATVSGIENSALGQYDIHVDPTYVGISSGSNLRPYDSLTTAIAQSSEGDSILIKGTNTVTGEITLPHGVSLYGAEGAEIKYASYSTSNGDIFEFDGTDNTQEFVFDNIKFSNAGGYGLLIKKAAKVTVEDCVFENNGWDGTALNTVLDSATSGVLGYDSTNTELQAFYAGSHASNGGAMRIQEAPQVLVIGNTVKNNLRGIRVQDCGVNGAGFISRNQASNNIESGIYLAVGALGGCQNVTVINNFSAYNANNGLLCIGGINNKFSQNEVNGNWNAGLCGWGSANLTLRDCGLYNNNRSTYNGIGNTGDAKASVQINDAASFIATAVTLNPDFRFIAEILGNQIHYTGLGSSTSKIGVHLNANLGSITDNDKNVIRIDDCGFLGQDYAVDFSEVDVTNLRVALGDNSYQSVGELSVAAPSNGDYYEQPFSNHVMDLTAVDVAVDSDGAITVLEGASGRRLNPYKVNDLKAVERGTMIDVILKDSDKIAFSVDAAYVYNEGNLLTGTVAEVVNEMNAILQQSGTATNGQVPSITSSLAVTMTEGDTLNYELTADFAVGYEWNNLPSGVVTVEGNLRKLIGGSSLTPGTYNIGIKAINYNGVDTDTLVLTVVSAGGFTNTKSVWIQNLDFLAHTNADGGTSILDTLERTDSDSGSAWSISMWIRPVNDSRGQVWFYNGKSQQSTEGAIEIRQVSAKRLRLRYGKNQNNKYIQLQTQFDVLNTAAWNHVVVTYDGGTTANDTDGPTRFAMYVNGTEITDINTSGSSNGYGGSIVSNMVRVGKGASGNQVRGGKVDELAILDTELSSSDVTTLYNSGAPTDLSSNSDVINWYRFGDGNTDAYPYIYDSKDENNVALRLTMNNQTAGNIVSDVP